MEDVPVSYGIGTMKIGDVSRQRREAGTGSEPLVLAIPACAISQHENRLHCACEFCTHTPTPHRASADNAKMGCIAPVSFTHTPTDATESRTPI
jgi:hypothetical protein